MHGNQIVGHISANVDPQDAFWGPCAGMSLLLDASARGRGLLRPIYRELLEGMLERGARSFKGGTNQPPVLRLGRIMGRSLQAVMMRREHSFEGAHFGPFVPGRGRSGLA